MDTTSQESLEPPEHHNDKLEMIILGGAALGRMTCHFVII